MPSLVPPTAQPAAIPDPLIGKTLVTCDSAQFNQLTLSVWPLEYATFLHPTFDANQFAHSIVNNEPYPPPQPSSSSSAATNIASATTTTATTRGNDHNPATATGQSLINGSNPGLTKSFMGDTGGDVSAALAKLNFGVEELSRQLKAEVRVHMDGKSSLYLLYALLTQPLVPADHEASLVSAPPSCQLGWHGIRPD